MSAIKPFERTLLLGNPPDGQIVGSSAGSCMFPKRCVVGRVWLVEEDVEDLIMAGI